MNKTLLRLVAGLALPAILLTAMPQAASASAASTAAWAAAAAAIVGTIYYDSSHRPYWRDHSGHMHYVSTGAATYYTQHHWNNTPPAQRRWQDQQGSWHHGCC